MYNPILHIGYYDINNQVTDIYIDQDGYSGSVTEVDGDGSGNTIEIKWGDGSSNSIPNIYGSQATIRFIADTTGQFSFLFTADAKKHKVRFLKDSVLVWTGFVEPENYSEPKIPGPKQVSITAFDGLGFLKEEFFDDSNGDPYTGKLTIHEIANKIFLKTGFALNENYAIPYQELGLPYLEARYDVDNFIELNCYEILQQIFAECRVMQRNAEWWVISNVCFDTTDTTIEYKKYDSARSLLSSSSFNYVTTDVEEFEGDPRIEMLPALKRLSVIQDYGYKGNLIVNGDFQDFNEDSSSPEMWTLVNTATASQRDLNDDGDKYILLRDKQKPTYPYQLSEGMYSQMRIETTDSVVKLALSYALSGNKGESCYLAIGVQLIGDNNVTYYLQQYGDQSTKEIKYQWVTSPQHGTAIMMNYHWTDWLSEYPNGINPDKVEAAPYDELANAFRKFECTIPFLPYAGVFRLYLWVPYSSRTNINGSAWHSVALEMLDENAEAYATSKTITITNNRLNNHVPDDLELMIGDVPDIDNKSLIYKNGLIRFDNSYTVDWGITGVTATNYTFAELIARIRASRQRLPLQSYSGSVLDLLPGLQFAYVDPYNNNIILLENGMVYKDDHNVCDGRYTQVLPIDLTAGELSNLITETTEGKERESESRSSSTTTQPSKDERVMLVGSEGQQLSSPGYLHGDYFEFDSDPDPDAEDIGIPLFKPKYFTHIEGDRITDLVTRSVQIDFNTPFTDVPAGLSNLKVYRWQQVVTGKWRARDVQYYFTSSGSLTSTGFSLEIETTESLTGVIIEYLFFERFL